MVLCTIVGCESPVLVVGEMVSLLLYTRYGWDKALAIGFDESWYPKYGRIERHLTLPLLLLMLSILKQPYFQL